MSAKSFKEGSAHLVQFSGLDALGTVWRDRITFVHAIAMNVLTELADRTDAVFFIDPLYTAVGKKGCEHIMYSQRLRVLFHPGNDA